MSNWAQRTAYKKWRCMVDGFEVVENQDGTWYCSQNEGHYNSCEIEEQKFVSSDLQEKGTHQNLSDDDYQGGSDASSSSGSYIEVDHEKTSQAGSSGKKRKASSIKIAANDADDDDDAKLSLGNRMARVMFGVLTTKDSAGGNVLCVDVHGPQKMSTTPSMDIEIPINGSDREVLDAICAVVGRRTDGFFNTFADPADCILLSVSAATVNISLKGIAANGLRQIAIPLPNDYRVPEPGPGTVAQTLLKLCVYLKDDSVSALGGGKAAAVPSKSKGGSGSMSKNSLVATSKTYWISTVVLEYEKNQHGNSRSILKDQLQVEGLDKQSRRTALMGVLEAISDKVNQAELAKGPTVLSPPKLAMVDLYNKELDNIDMSNLPAGLKHRQRKAIRNNQNLDGNFNETTLNAGPVIAVAKKSKKEEIEEINSLFDLELITAEQKLQAINKVLNI